MLKSSADSETIDMMVKRSLLARSKRAIIVKRPDGDLFCCVECPLKFDDKKLMEQHMTVHNKEYRFLCGICGTGLKRKEHLDRHTMEHKEVRPHVCPECGKGFKRKEHLNIHRSIHSGEKNQVCPLCDKSFYRKDHLQKHLQTHNKMFIEQNIYPLNDQELDIKQEVDEEMPVAADDVNAFDSQVMMEIHDALSGASSQESQPGSDRPYVCLVCGKGYKRRDHLKMHSVVHLKKDKFCSECGKGFAKEEQLLSHMKVHLKSRQYDSGDEQLQIDEGGSDNSLLVARDDAAERRHACELCGRRFKRKQHLKVHANVHTALKPTIWCSLCSEGFFSNNQFEQHSCQASEPVLQEDAPAPTETNQENNYPMEFVQVMNEPIASEEALSDEQNIPVPRRVFVCRYCGKPFKRKDHYKIHLHIHTGVKSFFCTDCGKGFYRKDHLQKHSQVHFKPKPPPPRKPARREPPGLYPISLLKTELKAELKADHVMPEITITAPSNTKLRVPLQIKVPYQMVTSLDNGEQRAVTVDPQARRILA